MPVSLVDRSASGGRLITHRVPPGQRGKGAEREDEHFCGELEIPASPDGGGFVHRKSGAQPPSDENLSLGSG